MCVAALQREKHPDTQVGVHHAGRHAACATAPPTGELLREGRKWRLLHESTCTMHRCVRGLAVGWWAVHGPGCPILTAGRVAHNKGRHAAGRVTRKKGSQACGRQSCTQLGQDHTTRAEARGRACREACAPGPLSMQAPKRPGLEAARSKSSQDPSPCRK